MRKEKTFQATIGTRVPGWPRNAPLNQPKIAKNDAKIVAWGFSGCFGSEARPGAARHGEARRGEARWGESRRGPGRPGPLVQSLVPGRDSPP